MIGWDEVGGLTMRRTRVVKTVRVRREQRVIIATVKYERLQLSRKLRSKNLSFVAHKVGSGSD